ncbi:MAG: outer membrane protein insertion porin family [Desulfovibrionales bacterium]|jgi:outer membrane protein insertion porin family|nr:outer membrane protein insertion porin family [Desulfovibrionales bacterium]
MPKFRRPVLSALFASFIFFALQVFALAAPNAATKDVRIVVLPFGINAQPEFDYLKESLPELVADRLREAGFDVVARARVDDIIAKQHIEYLDLQMARDLALLAGGTYALYGSFNQVGESISLDARLVEAFGLKPPVPLFVNRDGLINLLPAIDALVEKVNLELLKKQRIADVDVVGCNVLDKNVVLMRLSIKKGDVYDPKTVNANLKRIYDLGYFDDVRVKLKDGGDGKTVVFEVKEKPLIQAVGVKGADAINADDILAAVTTKRGSVLNPKTLSEDLATIREMYRKEGYYKAKVSYELEGDDPRQKRLSFVIDEGPELYIEGITIAGAKNFDEDDIKDELALSERNIFSWITQTGVLKEEMLDRDAAAIQAFYANRGFIDAKVGQPEVDIRDDGIYITFNVQEGPRYKVGKVTFGGDLITSTDKLYDVIDLDNVNEDDEESMYLDRSTLREDMKLLADYYSNFGYAYAEADATFTKHTDVNVIDIQYLLSKHQKVYIRRVVIQGNTKTRDNVILREMRLADGDMFNGFKLRRSAERLRKLDYFDEMDIEPAPTGNPNEMDLKVKVKDKSTGMLSGGAGYSSYEGVFFAGKIQERNLFGKGYNLGFSGKWSEKTMNGVLSFYNPNYEDTPLGVGLDLYATEYEYDDYSRDAVGGILNFSYPLGEYTRAYWGYNLEDYRVYDIDDDASQTLKDSEGTNVSSSVYVAATRDTTNRKQNPSSGTINTARFEMGGGPLGGGNSYVKYIYTSQYYRPMWWETIFHIKGEIGLVHENIGGNDVEVFERFSLGGLETVRGYSWHKISPIDPATGDRIGGLKEFYMNVEYLFPISKENGIVGVTFFDAGNVWEEGQWYFEDTKQDDGSPLLLGLYKSVGVGLRWYSPMGPLRLEYGYGLDDLEGSPRNKIEFSMGQDF